MKPCVLTEGDYKAQGYSCRTVNRKRIYLHREILEQKLGRPIKEGYFACHSCNVRNCIEPEHIYEGTAYENNWDRFDLKGHNWSRKNGPNYETMKTHCPRNHPYDLINTYFLQGRRYCKTCLKEHAKNRRERIRERNKRVAI